MELNVPEVLGRFLSYLLDARWFPVRDGEEMRALKAQVREVLRIVRRMEAFSRKYPDGRLEKGLAEWENYLQTTAQIARQSVSRSPHMKTSRAGNAETEIAERLLCASLIIPMLWPDGGIYTKLQELLAQPEKLPYIITVTPERAKELRARKPGTPVTASEWHYLQNGCDIPLRRYSKSEKTLQSAVKRLQDKIRKRLHFDHYKTLEWLYGLYLWSQKGQSGFSDAEAQMLRSLVPTDRTGNGSPPAVPRRP